MSADQGRQVGPVAEAAARPKAMVPHVGDASPPVAEVPDRRIPSVPPDVMALMPWMDDVAHPATRPPVAPAAAKDPVAQIRENIANVQAQQYAAVLVNARGQVDNKQARFELLNTLDRVDDPEIRQKMLAKFQESTGQSLEAFIEKADWHGGRDKQEALRLISPERDVAAAKIKAMSPVARKELESKANEWAQRVLAVTRTEDPDSDEAAADIFRTLGPRSPEEVEMVRAAVRRNTNGQHGIYEELDRSLSGNTEDEAVAGLSGNPVHAAWVGLKNVDNDPARTLEILRGLTPEQRKQFQLEQAVLGSAWITAGMPPGADREEAKQLLAGNTTAADGEHYANLLRDPTDGAMLEMSVSSVQKSAQTKKFEAARAPVNVIKEFESKSPAELMAAKAAYDESAKGSGRPSWDEMLEARFKGGDAQTYMRLQALSRGDRAESKVLGFRGALETNNQAELEPVLASPDLTSSDPAKRAAAEQERVQLGAKIAELDARDEYAQAVMRGENPGAKRFVGRDASEQLADHFDAQQAGDENSARMALARDVAANGIVFSDSLDSHRTRRIEATRDNRFAAEEVWRDGKVAASTDVHRSEKEKDTEKKLAVLEGLKTQQDLDTIEADYKRKYKKDLLTSPDQSAYYVQASLAKGQGDPRSISEITTAIAHRAMSANQLRIENLRDFGPKAERRPDLELRLQQELYQNSTAAVSSQPKRPARPSAATSAHKTSRAASSP